MSSAFSAALLASSHTIFQGLDHGFGVGESALSKEASEQSDGPFANQQLAVDKDVELS